MRVFKVLGYVIGAGAVAGAVVLLVWGLTWDSRHHDRFAAGATPAASSTPTPESGPATVSASNWPINQDGVDLTGRSGTGASTPTPAAATPEVVSPPASGVTASTERQMISLATGWAALSPDRQARICSAFATDPFGTFAQAIEGLDPTLFDPVVVGAFYDEVC